MAYDEDWRQKLLKAIDTHQASQARLAEIFGVSLSWVKGVVRGRRETGNPHALPAAPGRSATEAERGPTRRDAAVSGHARRCFTARAAGLAPSPASSDFEFVQLVASPSGDELAA